jgi:hypothetical protein
VNNYKSGYWKVTKSKAKELVGKHIYLHDTQAGASYFGGYILDYTMTKEWDGKPRAVFYFEVTAKQKGVKTQEDWGVRSEKYFDDNDDAHFMRKKKNPIGVLEPCSPEQWDQYKKESSSRHP